MASTKSEESLQAHYFKTLGRVKQEPQAHEVPADPKAQEENQAGKVHQDRRATRCSLTCPVL